MEHTELKATVSIVSYPTVTEISENNDSSDPKRASNSYFCQTVPIVKNYLSQISQKFASQTKTIRNSTLYSNSLTFLKFGQVKNLVKKMDQISC